MEYNRPGFPGDGYGFSTDDRMTYGSYAVDYLSNWSGPRYLGDLVHRSGDKLFKDGEVSHMADVKLVILSTFGAGVLCWSWPSSPSSTCADEARGGVRRGLFAGSIVTLAMILGLGTLAVLGWQQFFTEFHRIFFAGRLLDVQPGRHPDPAVPGPVLDRRRHCDRRAGAAGSSRDPGPDLAHPPAPRPGTQRVNGHCQISRKAAPPQPRNH